MKSILTLLFFGVTFVHVTGQGSNESLQLELRNLEFQKERIFNKLDLYQDSLDWVLKTIEETKLTLDSLDVKDQENRINLQIGKGITVEHTYALSLREKPSNEAKIILTIPKDKKFTVLGVAGFPHFKVKYKGTTGFVNGHFLDFKGSTIELLIKELETKSNVYQDRKASPHLNNDSSGPTSIQPTNSPSYQNNSPTIHTGPKGGQYYYTPSGKKRYLSQDKKH